MEGNVVGVGIVTGLWGDDLFHGKPIEAPMVRVDVTSVFEPESPLLHPNYADDPQQLVLKQVEGGSTLWHQKFMRKMRVRRGNKD